MGLEYLPTFTIKNQLNVGEYIYIYMIYIYILYIYDYIYISYMAGMGYLLPSRELTGANISPTSRHF